MRLESRGGRIDQGQAGDLVSSESEALAEIRDLIAGIIPLDGVVFGTHYETCFRYHAGCLAAYIADMCAEVTS